MITAAIFTEPACPWRKRRHSRRSCALCSARTGWSTPSRRLADRNMSCSIWRATRIESRSPIIRLLSVDDREVGFRWKDYAHHNKRRTMTLAHEEFLRRFLQHVLPKGFPRIRYFGWLANRSRGELLPLCRTLLGCVPSATPPTSPCEPNLWQCPCCQGTMHVVERLTATHFLREEIRPVPFLDSS